MKTRRSRILLLCGLLWLGCQPLRPLHGQTSEALMGKLDIEESDIDRLGSLPNTFAPIVKRVLPAVVSISSARVTQRRIDPLWDEILRHHLGDDYVPQARTHRQQRGLGSGVLVTTDGFIVTNYHVIQGANEITVTLPESRESFQADVIAADPSADVALLKIEGSDFSRAPLGNSDLIEVGDVVLAVGNPFELDQTVTQGIVSAKGRRPVGSGGNFIQTDAAINPGNSGGSLVDSAGRVIGINSMVYSTTGASTGIGFAIPIKVALRVIRDLLDKKHAPRGFLGVKLEALTPAMARRLARRDLGGVRVAAVSPDSPAARAGLQADDLIVEFQGRSAIDLTRLRSEVSRTAPGTRVTLGVVRHGRLVDVPVVLDEAPGNEASVNGDGRDRDPAPGEVVPVQPGEENLATPFYLQGVSTQTLDDSIRNQLDLDETYEGAVVVQVDPRSPAGRSGLQVGDLIVEVGRSNVRSSREALAVGQDLEGDSVILGIIRSGKEQFVLVKK